MATDAATMEFSSDTKTLGEQIVKLTLKQAKDAIRGHNAAYARYRSVLKFLGNLRHSSCRAVREGLQLFEHFVRKLKKARQPCVCDGHPGTAKKKDLPRVPRDQ